MKFKARLKRLAADVHWLKYDGALNVIEKQMRLLELMRGIEAAKQRQAEAAKTPKKAVVPPAAPKVSPVEAPSVPVQRQALPDSPPDSPPVPPLVQPFVSDIPEHMQIRPVQWRIRGPDDPTWEKPGTNGRCLTEYDVLASEDDNDDDD